MSKPTCNDCQAYSAMDSECRRKSPTVVPVPVNGQVRSAGMFPGTKPERWCLDHVPMPEPKEKTH